MNCKNIGLTLAACAVIGSAAPAAAMEATTVTFDQGKEGWQGPKGSGGFSFIARRIGNGKPAYRTVFEDFGISFVNHSNSAFIGDYGALPALTLGLDVNTRSLDFFGSAVTREFVVELRDHDNVPDGMPYVSVWYSLGTLDAADPGWHTLSVDIADTRAAALPAGWGGYGAEDPVTFEPVLPAGRTFANVLAGVDEIAFTTLVPGFFYGAADFDVAVDNIFIRALSPVSEPARTALFALGLAAMGWRLRSTQRRQG